MSSDHPPELRPELLDDFYAECDELLTSSRAALLALESNLGKPAVVNAQVEALFRHVHSIKGNSAIVGLRAAEELAHGMEDLLRGLAKQKVTLSAEMVDVLLGATQRLEQIVTQHRVGKPAPEIADALAAVRRLAAAGMKGSSAPMEAAAPEKDAPEAERNEAISPEDAARARGLTLWRWAFTPTPALDKRGVNVSSVRTRLAKVGEIIRATPSVRGKGIVFEFVVALSELPKNAKAWGKDGVTFEPMPAPVPEAKEAPAVAVKKEVSEAVPTVSTVMATAVVPPEKPPLVHEELSLTPSHMVRVDLARLDELMRVLGEMVIHRSRLEDRIGQVKGDTAPLKEVNLALARSLRDMREAISRVRLVPIAEIFTRMPFVVRELVRDSDKKARVMLEGHHTVVDKYLVERLKEPLLHLVRNSFAHGIEPAAARVAAGKPAEATITLRATSVGDLVVIQIRDDGRGVDAAAVVARAKVLGLPVPEKLDRDGVLGVLCLPGFSTRDRADLAAGRGVGMAVVANTVRELGGRLTLETWPGQGTEFTLRLPLTLSIVEALIATVGDQLCAVPQTAVEEIEQAESSVVRQIQQTEVIPYRGGLLPLVRLRAIFKLEPREVETLTIMVVRGERGATGLVVDAVRMQREVVVRPLLDPLLRVPGIAGATELGDGRPILMLDPVSITKGIVRPPESEYSPTDSSASARRAP